MTSRQWALHRMTYCASCRRAGRCPAFRAMDRDPRERQHSGLFSLGRDGHCREFDIEAKGDA